MCQLLQKQRICFDLRRKDSSCYHLTSGYSFIERLQAARHSTLVMCVAASQKPMQSASDLPPPPGLLGADWLRLLLPDELPGERASEEPPELPLPVSGLMGKGSDMGDSGVTPDPVVGALGTVVAAAEVVDGNDVDGADGVVPPEDTLGAMMREVVGGAETLGAGAAPADERACANAASGNSSTKAIAARTGGLGVSIAITIALSAVPQPSIDPSPLLRIHNLASERRNICTPCIPRLGEPQWIEYENVGPVIVRLRPWSDDIHPDAVSDHAVLAPAD